MEAGADTQAFNADLSETAENKVLEELKLLRLQRRGCPR